MSGTMGPADPKKAAIEILRAVREACSQASTELFLNILIDENFVDAVRLNRELTWREIKYDLDDDNDETILVALEVSLEKAEKETLIRKLVRGVNASFDRSIAAPAAATTSAKAALRDGDEVIDAVPVEDEISARFRAEAEELRQMRLAEAEKALRPRPSIWEWIKGLFASKPKAATHTASADFPTPATPRRPERKSLRERISASKLGEWVRKDGKTVGLAFLITIAIFGLIWWGIAAAIKPSKPKPPAASVATAAAPASTSVAIACYAGIVLKDTDEGLVASITSFQGADCPDGLAFEGFKTPSLKVLTAEDGAKYAVDYSKIDWTERTQALPLERI